MRPILPLLLALMVLPHASVAQTTIFLSSDDLPACRAITDPLGIRLTPMGLSMTATGVQFVGCTVGTPFDTDMLPVGGPYETGQLVLVRWSAGLDVTYCVYGGSHSIPGWQLGATACSGYGCAGMHTSQVTLSQPGSYQFSITCTDDDGHAAATMIAN